MAQALALPAFRPGVVIDIPLSLAPDYLQLHQLQPMSQGEIRDRVRSSLRTADGMVWVKRAAVETEVSHV